MCVCFVFGYIFHGPSGCMLSMQYCCCAQGNNNRRTVFLVPYTFVFVMRRRCCVVDAELDPVSVSQEHAAT